MRPTSNCASDEASAHVYDPAIEPVQMVNEILFMEQLGADRMVNQGPYNAQIDEAKCQKGSDPACSGSQFRSGRASWPIRELALGCVCLAVPYSLPLTDLGTCGPCDGPSSLPGRS